MKLVELKQFRHKACKVDNTNDNNSEAVTIKITKRVPCLLVDDEALNELARKSVVGKRALSDNYAATLELAAKTYVKRR